MTGAAKGVVRYVAKIDADEAELPPLLLRVTRDEDGYEHEQTWASRFGEWRYSHHLLDDRVGKDNYDELIEIGEQRALEIQAAWRRRLAAEDGSS